MIDQETQAVVEKARALAEHFPNDPQYGLMKKAFEQEWELRQATQKELDRSFACLQETLSQNDQAKTAVQQSILSKISQDQQWTITFNDAIKSDNPTSEEEKISYPVRTNKLFDIQKGAHDFVNQPDFPTWLDNIASGNFNWPGYRYWTEQSEITFLGNQESDTIYGTSKGTFYKTVLLNTQLQYSGVKQINLHNQVNWYIAPFPARLLTNYGDAFKQDYTYYYNGPDIQGLLIPHGGYAFGGSRTLPEQKPFGPEDCSSWIGKLSCGTDKIATRDLFRRARGEAITYFQSYEEPIHVRDPQKDIQSGQVMSRHTFYDHEHKNYKSGHTFLVLGVQGEEVIGIGYNRSMPDKEGFGIERFPVKPTSHQELFFFPQKQSQSVDQALASSYMKP